MSSARDETLRDTHLYQALRHAPDAAVEPHRALDETVLRAARAAVRHDVEPQRLMSKTPWWKLALAWWQRPTMAPAFVVLALSIVMVSLWRDEPIPDAVPTSRTTSDPGQALVDAQAAPPARPTDITKTPAQSTAATVAPPLQTSEAPTLATATPKRPGPVARPEPSPKPASALERNREANHAPDAGRTQATSLARAPAPAPAVAAPAVAAPAVAAPAVAAPAVAAPAVAAPAAAPHADEASIAQSAPSSRAAEGQVPNAPRATPAMADAPTAKMASASLDRSAATASGPSRLTQAAEFPAPLWRIARVQGRSSWSLRNAGGDAPTLAGEREQAWLSRLIAATRGRWQAAPQPPTRANMEGAIELYDAGAFVGRLIVGKDDVRFVAPDGTEWVADVGEQTIRNLAPP